MQNKPQNVVLCIFTKEFIHRNYYKFFYLFFRQAETWTCPAHKINHKTKQQNMEAINMSDLSATNCGCGNTRESSGNNGCCSLIWLIILFSLFNNNDSCGCGCGGGLNLFNGGSDGCGCNSIIWLLILFSCCGSSF